MNSCKEVMDCLLKEGSEADRLGMARFGINTDKTLGVSMPKVKELAKSIKKNHPLALELWQTGVHEARILAGLVADPRLLTEEEMDAWVQDFNSWDVCDQVCMKLFCKSPFANKKIEEWHMDKEEFVKRAAFATIAGMYIHDKKSPDEQFYLYFDYIKAAADDERNFVKKAVNWALRQLGKKNKVLHAKAIETAEEIRAMPYKSARWIAADALRELQSAGVVERLDKMG